MKRKSLMVLGTMSSAGKSVLATGICRLYARRGWRVIPFKAQNMSNNAAVCSGGEIGRAQAAQAFAAGVEPSVDMNPVLIKPEADNRGQVIVHGQVWETLPAADYYTRRARLWDAVTESLDRLLPRADLLVIEGAGSPVELNLSAGDMANLAVARYMRAPCLLAGDIDRGGIFAQLLGTVGLMEAPDQALVKAFVVNKFRGDRALFDDGVRILQDRGGVPVLGVLPYIVDLGIADEDSAALEEDTEQYNDAQEIAVVALPHISNFDDLDPLRMEPGVRVRFVRRAADLHYPAAVVLPGSKSTLDDLAWLHDSGFAREIRRLARNGKAVVGLCGGFQMLGDEVIDETGVESRLGRVEGLGLLPVRTRIERTKTVTRSRAVVTAHHGFWAKIAGTGIEGYEIHMGRSETSSPLFTISHREESPISAPDGACDASGRIFGTYLHGLFENDILREAWLCSLGIDPGQWSFAECRMAAYERLADELAASMDIALLDQIVEKGID